MAKMKTYTFEEILDEELGKIGTPKRDQFEQSVEAEIQAYHIGEALKKARINQQLTQKQLSERMGVSASQVSTLETGKNLSFLTISKALRALNIRADLVFDNLSFSLW